MDLRPYQQEAVRFLGEQGRAIYGDAPGTGKTATTLTWLTEQGWNRTLIVAPLAVLDHWQAEAGKWAPGLTVVRGDGSPKARLEARNAARACPGPSALLLHYEALRGDVEALLNGWDALVCDEAHRLKGRSTLVTKAARRVARRVEDLVLVTGTPMMNRAEELWSLLNLIDPQRYSSFWRFAEEFFETEQRYFGANPRPTTLIHGLKRERLAEFRSLVHPVLIQRSLDECLPDIADAVEIPVPVTLRPGERKVYAQMEKHAWADIGNGAIIQASNHLAKITRLRQMTSDFASVVDGPAGSKAKATIELVRDLVDEGEQVVVLTAYKATARAIQSGLHNGQVPITSAIYTGDSSAAERECALGDFKSGNAPVLIGTIATLGEGVDGLQGARYLVMVDQDWTPARNEQAVARLRRSGQERTVVVYQVYAVGTIDETVHQALASKQDVIEAVLGA